MLDQTSVHCPIFLTAGRRVSLDLISVPVWLIILLRPTKDRRLGKLLNYQQPNPKQIYLTAERTSKRWENSSFTLHEPLKFIPHLNFLKKIFVQDWKVKFCMYSPVRHENVYFPFDLHVLSILLAFILSQDQTHIVLIRCINIFYFYLINLNWNL